MNVQWFNSYRQTDGRTAQAYLMVALSLSRRFLKWVEPMRPLPNRANPNFLGMANLVTSISYLHLRSLNLVKSNRINDVTDFALDESVKCLYQLVLSSLSRSGRSFNVYHATSGTDPNERWGCVITLLIFL